MVQLTIAGLSRKTEKPAKDNRKDGYLVYMKQYCKDIDILDIELITRATYKCLDDKYGRNDTLHLLSEESGLEPNQIYCIFKRYGKAALFWIVDSLVLTIQKELIQRELHFPSIWYKEKVDPSSLKIRRIGIQNIKQQIYDYIAVEGLEPFLHTLGEHQYASIKRKGCVKGVRQIRRWLRNKNIRYYAKADIHKCFESIDRKILMDYLRKHIENDLLLWLIETLICTFEKGLSIGSYLSQHLCNLFMSVLYHEISHMHKIKKSRRTGKDEYVSLVVHQLFYMDDILLAGTNAKDLHKAVKEMIKFAADKMHLEIKLDWVVSKIQLCTKHLDKIFIDMMGYRIYRWHTTIRRRVFKKVRKAYMKTYRFIKLHYKISLVWANRCVSYYGQIKNSDSFKFSKKYHVSQVLKICKGVKRDYDKGTIRYAAV